MSVAVSLEEEVEAYRDWIRTDPVGHAKVCLQMNLWKKQREILKAAADPNITKISIRSGNGVGKTFLTAALGIQWLDTHQPGYCVYTGASWNSVLKTVWPTLRKVLSEAPLHYGAPPMATEWRRGNLWGAFCVSPDEPENFGGYRSQHGACVIVDEASSLSQKVYEAIQGVCSAEGSKIIMLGNPIRPDGPFHDSFHSAEWTNFHISSEEVVDLGIPGLATQDWIESMIKEYGEDSHVVRSRVKGQFPGGEADTLISLNWLGKILIPRVMRLKGELKLGVDVARFGDDRTVLLVRDDRCVKDMLTYSKKSTMETVGLVQEVASKYHVDEENIFIDDTGLGGGVTDRLHELGFSVVPVNFGERATDKHRFVNVRAEMYWNIRNAMKPDSTSRLYVPKEFGAVAKECAWPRYKIQSDRRIQLEDKAAIKQRRKRSPDLADALALTYYGETSDFSMEAA